MIRPLLVLFLTAGCSLTCSGPTTAQPKLQSEPPACPVACPHERSYGSVMRVLDGDTLELSIDLGYEVSIMTQGTLRADTPELYGKALTPEEYAAAKAASEFTARWVAKRDPTVWVWGGLTRAKNGLWLVDVCDTITAECLSEAIVKEGHGTWR